MFSLLTFHTSLWNENQEWLLQANPAYSVCCVAVFVMFYFTMVLKWYTFRTKLFFQLWCFPRLDSNMQIVTAPSTLALTRVTNCSASPLSPMTQQSNIVCLSQAVSKHFNLRDFSTSHTLWHHLGWRQSQWPCDQSVHHSQQPDKRGTHTATPPPGRKLRRQQVKQVHFSGPPKHGSFPLPSQ